MADKFRVGQKVRLVKVNNAAYKQYEGKEFMIKGPSEKRKSKSGKEWSGYDIGLTVNSVNLMPSEKILERVFSPPVAGLAKLSKIAADMQR